MKTVDIHRMGSKGRETKYLELWIKKMGSERERVAKKTMMGEVGQ